jgi:hypothetical protein
MESCRILLVFLQGFKNLVGMFNHIYLQGQKKDLAGIETVYSKVNFSDKTSFLKS